MMRTVPLLAGLVLAAATLVSGPEAVARTRELRLGLVTPPPHVWTRLADRMGQTLAGEPDVGLTLKIFPASQLGNEPEMLQQMQAGLLDMGIVTASVLSLREPSLNGWFTPYLFSDVGAAARAAATPAAREMLGNLEKSGLVGLGYTFAGMRHVLMRTGPVRGLEDLAYKKIRIVPFPAMEVWWKAIGAAPTPVHLSAVYQSLQTGVLDGVDIDLDALVGMKLHEVARHLSLTNHMAFPGLVVVSRQTWRALAEPQRGRLQALVEDALQSGLEQQIAAEAAHRATLRDAIEVTELADGEDRFARANAAFAERFGGDKLIARFLAQVRGQ